MGEKDISSMKPIGTREWYDFVGQLADILPHFHQGGEGATETLLEMCDLNERSHVLDVGCGAGSTACIIAERYGAYVQGIDISEVMISKAEDRANKLGMTDKVTFRVADVYELPFEDDSFDVVIIESVLLPLPGDKKKAMAEMVRVLRPGGRMGANEGTIDPSIPPELLSLLDEHPAFYGHFTPQTLRSLFEASGLQSLEVKEVWNVETPKALQGMGFRDVLSFMLRAYPKMLLTLIRDQRLRKASKIDDEVKKISKQYLGYVLIVGRKPV